MALSFSSPSAATFGDVPKPARKSYIASSEVTGVVGGTENGFDKHKQKLKELYSCGTTAVYSLAFLLGLWRGCKVGC